MKGYLKTYNHVKYFQPYLSSFCLRPLFTPNLRGGFQILKPKSRDLLPRNLAQTYNSLISNCCQNFMLLHQTVLEYKQKSEISPSLVGKWSSKNKRTRDASVIRSNNDGFCRSRVFALQKYAYPLTASILPFFSFSSFTLKKISCVGMGISEYRIHKDPNPKLSGIQIEI